MQTLKNPSEHFSQSERKKNRANDVWNSRRKTNSRNEKKMYLKSKWKCKKESEKSKQNMQQTTVKNVRNKRIGNTISRAENGKNESNL